ncbi:MAG TPA: hypothetical protein VFB32_04720 [Rudaea sp.]|nr:hypothetical protein [Rudaea sp.]
MRNPVLFVCALATAGTVQAGDYTVLQDRPETGTHIARAVAEGARIPLDKSYAELSPAQQHALKAEYSGLGVNDEPPFPSAGLKRVYQALAGSYEVAPASGELALLVDVDAKGDPGGVTVVRTPDPRSARRASAALMREKFKPALCSGHPCAMQYRFDVMIAAR